LGGPKEGGEDNKNRDHEKENDIFREKDRKWGKRSAMIKLIENEKKSK